MTEDKQGPLDDEELARRLLAQARPDGVSLTGPGGLLGSLTKRVLETALEGDMDGHLGYAKGDPAGSGQRQLEERETGQDGGDRGRSRRHRGPQRP